MPKKGTRKNNPNPTPSTHLKVSITLYEKLEVVAKERGLINPRNGQGNRSKLIEEMLSQLSYLDKAKVFYAQVKEYADGCQSDSELIKKAIVDILFPLGLWGEDEQRKKLKTIAHPRHHEKIWELLKFYETINNVSVYID